MLGINVDSPASHRAWGASLGGLPYPELSDFHPKGQVSQAYDVWNDERGVSVRSVFVIDKGGTIRYRKSYTAPDLPDMEEIIGELGKIG